MEIPSGKLVKESVALEAADFLGMLCELKAKRFNGYLALTFYGDGLEEGLEFFDSGAPVASVYEYFPLKRTYLGKDAWPRLLNASAGKNGVIDVVELSSEQVKLFLAFNESAVAIPPAEDLKPRRIAFSGEFASAAAREAEPATREALLRKYGITPADAKPVEERKEGAPLVLDYFEKLFKKKG
ncbi:hypothetical protein HY995_04340 [Candidatus Micrarchaeota archaeon]|nr:hypothetical protein [Candidatus Micrarchaeota archaeon]MBI5177284.1 hypothetical protein [Candidatus Micrarchaeota archaeon]